MTKRFCDLCGKPAVEPGRTIVGVETEMKEQKPGLRRQMVICTPQFVVTPASSLLAAERHADLCRGCMVDQLKQMAVAIGRLK